MLYKVLPLKTDYDNISNIIQGGPKTYTTGGGNMDRGLRSLPSFTEDIRSIPSTHMVVYSHF